MYELRLKKQFSIEDNQMTTLEDEINSWFPVRIKKQWIRQAVEQRVDIMAAPRMQGTRLVYLEIHTN